MGHCLIQSPSGYQHSMLQGRWPKDVSAFTVYLGAYQLTKLQNSTAVARGVKRIIVHPVFTVEGASGDIALIELNNPVTFNTYILPICLPSPNITLPGGTLCWATGWGDIHDSEALPAPKTLQEVQLPVINNQDCEAMYDIGMPPSVRMIQDDMMCAGYQQGKKDSCQGDSGGPLVCKMNSAWLQFGINSWGFGCADPNHPGVYTRVQYYRSWLQQYIPSIQFSNGTAVVNPSSTFSTTRGYLSTSSKTSTASPTPYTTGAKDTTTTSSTTTSLSTTRGQLSTYSKTSTASPSPYTRGAKDTTTTSSTTTSPSTSRGQLSTNSKTSTASPTPYTTGAKDTSTTSITTGEIPSNSGEADSLAWSISGFMFILLSLMVFL
ncbi:serine protease 27-like [Hyperolius riggenbachi]|uniref:serine protease 27-like n=1 Tax=Hyperolius riggenbachi TaxID=752182 RepID=UPI0035A30C10